MGRRSGGIPGADDTELILADVDVENEAIASPAVAQHHELLSLLPAVDGCGGGE